MVSGVNWVNTCVAGHCKRMPLPSTRSSVVSPLTSSTVIASVTPKIVPGATANLPMHG